MASPKTQIKNGFPKLSDAEFEVTSPEDHKYNCIAWAAEKSNSNWWPAPGYYWPDGLTRITTVDAFVQAFEALGFERCDSFNLEVGVDKVAIFTNPSGRPTHMARQLADGTWTSKLGKRWDIAHNTLVGLEGKLYGAPALALKRKLEAPKE